MCLRIRRHRVVQQRSAAQHTASRHGLLELGRDVFEQLVGGVAPVLGRDLLVLLGALQRQQLHFERALVGLVVLGLLEEPLQQHHIRRHVEVGSRLRRRLTTVAELLGTSFASLACPAAGSASGEPRCARGRAASSCRSLRQRREQVVDAALLG